LERKVNNHDSKSIRTTHRGFVRKIESATLQLLLEEKYCTLAVSRSHQTSFQSSNSCCHPKYPSKEHGESKQSFQRIVGKEGCDRNTGWRFLLCTNIVQINLARLSIEEQTSTAQKTFAISLKEKLEKELRDVEAELRAATTPSNQQLLDSATNTLKQSKRSSMTTTPTPHSSKTGLREFVFHKGESFLYVPPTSQITFYEGKGEIVQQATRVRQLTQ
jgi:hypothetical protein